MKDQRYIGDKITPICFGRARMADRKGLTPEGMSYRRAQ